MYTTIQKWGNSQGIRLPKVLLDALQIRENDRLEIIGDKEQIIIRKSGPQHKTLAERMEGYNGDYQFAECDWGKPVGNEVW